MWIFFFLLSFAWAQSEGLAKIGPCSGALVRLEGMGPDDPALMITNGHCVGALPNAVIRDQSYPRTVSLQHASGNWKNVLAKRILHASLAPRDLALIELKETYQDLEVTPFTVNASAFKGKELHLLSGKWNQIYRCPFLKTVPEIRLRFQRVTQGLKYNCVTPGGTSGSPLTTAGQSMVGLHFAGCEDRDCVDDPIEFSAKGTPKPSKNVSYGFETHFLYDCYAEGSWNFELPQCPL